MKTRWLAAVLGLVFLASAPVRAQPLADKIPADALVYIGWTGLDSMPAGYQDSHLQALMQMSNLGQVAGEALPQLLGRLGKQSGDAKLSAILAVEAAVIPMVLQHSGAFYFGGVDFTGPQPMPRLAFLCQAGAEAPALQKRLVELIAQAGAPPGLIRVTLMGDLVVVGLGPAAVPQPQPGGIAIAGSPRFLAATAGLHKDPFRIAYVDVQGVLALIDQVVEKQPDQEAREQWPKVCDALGLRGIHQAAWSAGFEGKDFGVRAFLDAPAPRGGLLSLLENGPVSDQALALIPKSAATATALRFDPAKVLPLIRQIAAGVDPDAAAQFDAALAQGNAMLGSDIQHDLLASLGSEWVLYTDRNVTGTGIWGTACINRLRDPAKAQLALGRLETVLNSMAQAAPKEIKLRIKTATVNGTTIHYLAVPVVAPAWIIKDGNLYLGLHPQTVVAAAERTAAGGPSILENPEFLKLRSRLGGSGPALIGFLDEPQLLGENYQFALLFSQGYLGLADLLGVDVPPLILPPVGKLLPLVAPAGGVAWSDDAGWHAHSVEPFPGSGLIANSGMLAGVGAGALAAGITMPALGAARAQASAVSSLNQVHQITMAAQMWSQDNANGHSLPPDLAALVGDGKTVYLTVKSLLSPAASVQVPSDFDNWDHARKTQWVRANSSYIYLGAGKDLDADPSTTVIIYEKPQFAHNGKIAIGFADGHCESLPVAEALRRIAAQEGNHQPHAPLPAPH
jgi:prepilin-type processing-associated H-X9-DG protein